MKTFLFECKKLLKKRTTWIAGALVAASLVALYFFSYHAAESTRKANVLQLEQLQQMFTSMAEEARTEQARAVRAGDEDAAQEAEEMIGRAEASVEKYKQWMSDYEKRNWKRIYQKEIDDLELGLSDVGGLVIEEQHIPNFTLRATKAEKEWLLKKGLDPLVQPTVYQAFLPTLYDTFTGKAADVWEKVTTRQGETGVGFTYTMMPKFYLPLLALLACFVFGNGLSSQMGRKERGLQFALTQPVRKSTLFTANYGSAMIAVVGFFLVLTVIPFLSSLFTRGVGSFQFPVLVYEGGKENPFGSEFNALNPQEDLFHFVTFQSYFGQALVLGILLALVLLGLYTLYSLLVKSSIGTLLLTGGTAAGAWVLFGTSPYNPFTYLDIHRILNGAMAAETFEPLFAFRTGVLVLSAAAVLLIVVNYLVFQWRSRRIAG